VDGMNSGKPSSAIVYERGALMVDPEPSRRYTAGRCRDYLRAESALNDRLELPHLPRDEEIVHSRRKRRVQSESLGRRFESYRAHFLWCGSRMISRDVRPDDFAHILALNEESVHFLSPLDRGKTCMARRAVEL